MLSFHNDLKIKEKYIARVEAHIQADDVIKGKYWENGKGCAVGCTIHGSDHKSYEIELGIPTWLVKLEDVLFEGMPNKNAKTWPFRFLLSIPVGVDLEKAKKPFLILMCETLLNDFDHKKYPEILERITKVIVLLKEDNWNILSLKDAVAVAVAAVAVAVAVAVAAVAVAAVAAAAVAHAVVAAAVAAAVYAVAHAVVAADIVKTAGRYLYLSQELLKILENVK